MFEIFHKSHINFAFAFYNALFIKKTSLEGLVQELRWSHSANFSILWMSWSEHSNKYKTILPMRPQLPFSVVQSHSTRLERQHKHLVLRHGKISFLLLIDGGWTMRAINCFQFQPKVSVPSLWPSGPCAISHFELRTFYIDHNWHPYEQWV